MAIRLINGAEFLHIPKTGGSWVTRVLEENNLIDRHIGGNKHADYDRVLHQSRLGSGYDLMNEVSQLALRKIKRRRGVSPNHQPASPIRFCFVRHPLSWYESWWKYMSGRGWNYWGVENGSGSFWHPNSILNGLGSDDFNGFVRNVIHKRPGYVSELYFAFTKPGIDFIGKTESLTEDLGSLLDMIRAPYSKASLQKTERINISKGSDVVEWDPDLRKTVMMLELPSLVHFGYLTNEERERMGLADNIEPNKAVQATSLRAVPDL